MHPLILFEALGAAHPIYVHLALYRHASRIYANHTRPVNKTLPPIHG